MKRYKKISYFGILIMLLFMFSSVSAIKIPINQVDNIDLLILDPPIEIEWE